MPARSPYLKTGTTAQAILGKAGDNGQDRLGICIPRGSKKRQGLVAGLMTMCVPDKTSMPVEHPPTQGQHRHEYEEQYAGAFLYRSPWQDLRRFLGLREDRLRRYFLDTVFW